jgi:hypothetical protein
MASSSARAMPKHRQQGLFAQRLSRIEGAEPSVDGEAQFGPREGPKEAISRSFGPPGAVALPPGGAWRAQVSGCWRHGDWGARRAIGPF